MFDRTFTMTPLTRSSSLTGIGFSAGCLVFTLAEFFLRHQEVGAGQSDLVVRRAVHGLVVALLIAAGTLLFVRSRTFVRRSTAIVLIVSVWSIQCLLSHVIHRSFSSTVRDLLFQWMTWGWWTQSNQVAGLATGRILSGIAVLGFLLSTVRPASLSRLMRSTFVRNERSAQMLATGDNRARRRLLALVLYVGSLGVVVFGTSLFDLFARQHVERATVDPRTGAVIELSGPLLPTLVWTSIAASMLGLLVFVPFILVYRPWRSDLVGSLVPAMDEGFGETPDRNIHPEHKQLFMFLSGAWITAFALWVRIATLLTVAPTRTEGGDPLFYHVTANLLAQGRGLPEPLNFIAFQRWIPSALHGPLYPVALSISSRLGGSTYFDHKFLSVLIGTGVVVMTMLVTHRVAPSRIRHAATAMAGILATIYPNLWLVDSVLFPEGLMALLTLVVVFVAYGWWERPALLASVLIGGTIALSALTRGEGLLLSILLVVPLFLSQRSLNLKQRLVHITAAGLSCLLILAPWALRNARSFESFVPLSTNGNELFVYANCPAAYEGKFLGFWLFQCQEDLRQTTGEPQGDEAEKSLYWRRIGLEYARANIDDLPRVVSARIGRQWDLFRPLQNVDFAPIEGRNKDAAGMGLFMYYSMIPFALVGARRLRRAGTRLLPIAAVFMSVTLTAAYAYGTTRFRVPFEPLLCLLAALGTASVIARLRSRWRASSSHIRPPDRHTRTLETSFIGGAKVGWRGPWDRSARATWISFSIVALGVATALPALFRSVGSSMEEGFMLVFPELLMRGLTPNVDFLHLYGPGSLHFLAGWFHIFGVSLTAERTFGLIQHVALIIGLMVVARPWGRAVSTVVGSVSLVFVLTPIGLQALAWNGALALGIWSVILAVRASNLRGAGGCVGGTWVGAGVLSGLALTFRPDVGFALCLAIGMVLWRRTARSIISVLMGLVLGLTPLWVHLTQAGLRATVEGIFLDPVFRLRAGRALPRPPSWDRLDGALQVISEKFAPWWGFPHLGAPKQLFLWFFLLPFLSVCILVVARSIPRDRAERTVLLAAALFGFGLLPQAFQRPDSAHFLWVSAISFPVAIIALVEWNLRRHPSSHPRVHLLRSASVVGGLLVLLLPFYTVRTYADLAIRSVTGRLEVREVHRDDRYFYLGDERPWQATLEVVEDLDRRARPGQRLFVGPVDLRQTAYSDAFFYHLFPELVPATYYIEMDPGLANMDPALATEVASSDWLILTRFWSGWIEPNDSIVFGSDEPNQVVEEFFCLEQSYQNDLVRLYRKCARGDGIGPYEGPYRPEYDYAVEVLVPVPARPDGTCTPTCWGQPSATGIERNIDTSIVN